MQRLRRYYNVREAPVTIMRSNGFHRCRCVVVNVHGIDVQVAGSRCCSRFHCHSIWFSSPFLFARFLPSLGFSRFLLSRSSHVCQVFALHRRCRFYFVSSSRVWFSWLPYACVCVDSVALFQGISRVVDKFYPANTAIFKHLD